MHKNIRATDIGRDKAISAIWVEEFDPPTWHAHLIRLQRTVSAPTRPEGEQRRRTGAWHTRRGCSALSASCPKELYPKSGLAAGRLIHCFDRISADRFVCVFPVTAMGR